MSETNDSFSTFLSEQPADPGVVDIQRFIALAARVTLLEAELSRQAAIDAQAAEALGQILQSLTTLGARIMALEARADDEARAAKLVVPRSRA